VFQVYIGKLGPSISARRNEKTEKPKNEETEKCRRWIVRNVRSPFVVRVTSKVKQRDVQLNDVRRPRRGHRHSRALLWDGLHSH